ncbi:MAG: VOC family protein [Gammaproteobacteria bacterium]|nr:VOC family protein [Gammaproteobacteria bacterium]MCP5198654.1 VOC family protein [Gammaproteobacteria bacterium]
MPLERLDHYFVYASDLDRSRRFYADVLGLHQGPRPDFDFPGYWFYLEDRPVVHVGNDAFEGGYVDAGDERRITGGTGPVDHIAFRGSDIEAFERRFDDQGVSYQRREVPDFKLSQLFVKDPEGVTIELNFFHAE